MSLSCPPPLVSCQYPMTVKSIVTIETIFGIEDCALAIKLSNYQLFSERKVFSFRDVRYTRCHLRKKPNVPNRCFLLLFQSRVLLILVGGAEVWSGSATPSIWEILKHVGKFLMLHPHSRALRHTTKY